MKRIWFFAILLSCQFVYAINHTNGLYLQIRQTFFEFNNKNIEQALVAVMPDHRAAILMKLKPEFAKQLTQISQSEIGQTALWVWNGKVVVVDTIKEPLNKDLTVFNLDPTEAERFVKSLKEE